MGESGADRRALSTRDRVVPEARAADACPPAPPAAAALRGQVVELSVELRDAHRTAPSTPIAFRGPLVAASP